MVVNVIVNGKKKTGEYLRDVISDEYYKEGCNIAIVKGIKKETKQESKKYRINTTKGPIVIGITEDNESVEYWNNHYKDFEGKGVRWKSMFDVSFGSVIIDLPMDRESKDFKKWDVVLSISGFDISEGHLVFIKKDITEVYGLKNPKIGRVIGGKGVLSKLESNDKIISIEKIRESKKLIDYIITKDLDLKLEENWEIFTYCLCGLDGPSKTVEHALAIMEDGYFEATESTNTFIADCRLQTLKIDEENYDDRVRGAITVRNYGNGIGKVYIYREGRTSSISHTVVGKVIEGMELVDFTDEGTISVKTIPERLCVIGKSVSEAKEIFDKYNIEYTIKGDDGENSIIIEQNPEYTLDVLKNKKVELKTLSEDKLLHIEIFDDKAPITSWYFRKTSGLTTKKVGKLTVYFKPAPDMVMFNRNEEYAKGLLPENTPKNKVDGGMIGVTNMVKRYKGYIGIRLTPHDKFGPTGETFEGTNIVGRVVKNEDLIKKLKMGDIVYLLEVK